MRWELEGKGKKELYGFREREQEDESGSPPNRYLLLGNPQSKGERWIRAEEGERTKNRKSTTFSFDLTFLFHIPPRL
jgi:hypothetical protein